MSASAAFFREILIASRDLLDIRGDGKLTQDAFAVAMHLIQGKLAGKPIPAVLPPTLIPPSMRGPPNGASAGTYTSPQQEAIKDLIWDDSPPSSAVNTAPAPAPAPAPVFQTKPNQDPFGPSFGQTREFTGKKFVHFSV